MTGRDAARDELAKTIQAYGSRFGYTVDIHLADCIAGAVLHAGYRKMIVTPEQIEAAKQTVAGNHLRRYESQYQADHLSWRDFYDEADEDVQAAARAFGLSVAEDGGQ